MRILILLWLLSVVAWATPPAEVVRQAFDYDKQKGMEETLKVKAACFTPGFLEIFQHALALPQGGKAFVDMDYFFCTQDGGTVFSVGDTQIDGKEAVVFLKTWMGAYRGAPAHKPPANYTIKVHLADVGQGFQIKDIEHLSRVDQSDDGRNLVVKGFSVRQDLLLLLQGRWPKH